MTVADADADAPAARHDAPYHRLADLPRTVWLPALITSAGERQARLVDSGHWLASLQAGQLPPQDAHFGDPAATAPLRSTVAELGLPALARGTPALAEQVLRTLLWHLDRIRRDFPMVMHGVSLNIGGAAPLNLDYLRDLKALCTISVTDLQKAVLKAMAEQ